MKLKSDVPFGLIAFFVSAIILIYAPLRQMTESGPILLFGSNVLMNNTIITLLGGSVCGLLLSEKSKCLGTLIGGLSSGAGSALYTYYFLSGGPSFILGQIGVLLALLITVGPGAYIYYIATRVKEDRANIQKT